MQVWKLRARLPTCEREIVVATYCSVHGIGGVLVLGDG